MIRMFNVKINQVKNKLYFKKDFKNLNYEKNIFGNFVSY
jgi:hypothetical protein